jgi:glycosyltransferase involved in cell wall biosynthesis
MINLFYVGRFVIRGKRIDKLLDLSRLLDKSNCDYNFKIFADVDLNSKEYKMFENNANFHFSGYKKDWVSYLEPNSIMVFVTEYEGCPLSILEAYKKGHIKISILEIPGIENYVSKNCISQNIEEMAIKIINYSNLENSIDLGTYYDKSRFEKEVESFYKFI